MDTASLPEAPPYKVKCVVCGGATGDFDDPQERLRTLSFGTADDEILVYVILSVCKQHSDMTLVDLRRHFYGLVTAVREYEGRLPLTFVPR